VEDQDSKIVSCMAEVLTNAPGDGR